MFPGVFSEGELSFGSGDVTRVLLDDIMDDVSASAPIKQRGTTTQTVRRKSADSLTIVIRI